MEEGKRELHFTYLDTVGRPVVVAHKTNLVEQHIQDFEVKADCGCIVIILCMREQIASLCVFISVPAVETSKISDAYDVSLQGSVRVFDGHNIMFNFKLLLGDNNQSWRLDTDLHIELCS